MSISDDHSPGTISTSLSASPSAAVTHGAPVPAPQARYNGFVAGLFSGMAKLAVGHPFDTVKVRLQTAPPSKFAGPLDVVARTFRNEGLRGFYKGATPPLVGWVFMDSLLMGSLQLYKGLLREHVFSRPAVREWYAGGRLPVLEQGREAELPPLPVAGHALAGTFAGWTVSFLAAPVEHVKARLQVQYSASKAQRFYQGPVDCLTKIVRSICHPPAP